MKFKNYFFIICLIATAVFSLNASAATITWINGAMGGAWTDTANWGGVTPMTGDDVVIDASTAITITDVPAISLNSLTIGGTSGGSVTLQSSAAATITIADGVSATDLSVAAGDTLVLDNTITLNATATGSVGAISGMLKVMGTSVFTTTNTVTTFASGSVYEHATATNTVAAANYASGSLLRITGLTTMSSFANNQLTSLPSTIGGSLEWNCPAQSGITGIWLPGGAGSTLNIGEDLIIASTGSSALTQGATTSRSVIVGRNYYMTGGTQNITGGGATYYSSSTFSFTVNGNATISGGNLVIMGVGNPNAANGTGNLTVVGSMTINGGTLTMTGVASGVGGMNFNLGGNLIHTSGTISCSAANIPALITLNGNTTQDIFTTGFSGAGTYSVTVNNPAGVTLSSDVTVTGTLTMTNGNIAIQNHNLIFGNTAAAIAGGPFSATKMIIADGIGGVQKMGTSAAQGSFMFPIGDNTGTAEYSPFTINFSSGTFSSGLLSVRVVNAKHPDNTIGISYINRFWAVDQVGITGFSATVTTSYADADIVGNESEIVMGQFNLTPPWILYPGSLNASTNTLTATGVTALPSQFSGVFDFITRTDKNLSSQLFSVYPNPAHELVTIRFADNRSESSKSMIEVFDALGSLVFEGQSENNETTISTRNFTSGVYFIKVTINKKTEVIRLVKM